MVFILFYSWYKSIEMPVDLQLKNLQNLRIDGSLKSKIVKGEIAVFYHGSDANSKVVLTKEQIV
jgi:hypothetical protein